jgi:hypothetical protein
MKHSTSIYQVEQRDANNPHPTAAASTRMHKLHVRQAKPAPGVPQLQRGELIRATGMHTQLVHI